MKAVAAPKPYATRPLPGFVLLGGDGNAFSIIGRFKIAARDAYLPEDIIADVVHEARSSDYDHLLRTFLPWESEDPRDE